MSKIQSSFIFDLFQNRDTLINTACKIAPRELCLLFVDSAIAFNKGLLMHTWRCLHGQELLSPAGYCEDQVH